MREQLVLLRLLGVCILWGCNYVASAYLLREFSPIFLSYSRLFLTSVFLVSLMYIGGKVKRPARKEWGLLMLAGIFGTLLNQLFYFAGLQQSTVGNASLIIALSPIATMILARIFLAESITVPKVSGALVSFAGIVVIVTSGQQSLGIAKGDLYLLTAMLGLSLSLLFVRRLSASMPSYDITILSTVIGTALMTPAVVMEGIQGGTQYSGQWTMWLILAAAAIIGQGLSGFWWNRAISEAGASTTAIFMNIPPFVAIILAYFLLGEPFKGSQFIGGALILAGVALAGRRLDAPAPNTLAHVKGKEM